MVVSHDGAPHKKLDSESNASAWSGSAHQVTNDITHGDVDNDTVTGSGVHTRPPQPTVVELSSVTVG